jgi:hypothetical protein
MPRSKDARTIDAKSLRRATGFEGMEKAVFRWDDYRRGSPSEATVFIDLPVVDTTPVGHRVPHSTRQKIQVSFAIAGMVPPGYDSIPLDMRQESDRYFAQDIDLEWTYPPAGGRRYYFVCPMRPGGIPCRSRQFQLYLPRFATEWGCRSCHRIWYEKTRDFRRRLTMAERLLLDTVGTETKARELVEKLVGEEAQRRAKAMVRAMGIPDKGKPGKGPKMPYRAPLGVPVGPKPIRPDDDAGKAILALAGLGD